MNFQHHKTVYVIKKRQAYRQKIGNNAWNIGKKALLLFIICLIAGFISQYLTKSDAEGAKTKNAVLSFYPIKALQVFDGDSFDANYNGKKYKIRLYGIDSPEKKQAYSKVSREFLVDLLHDKHVFLEIMYHDPFGRAVSILHFENGASAQEELLKAGLTWLFPRYCEAAICDTWRDLEKEAKNNKIGLWRDKKPTPPWQWRQNNK